MSRETFSIAQVTPYAWEEHHEVNRFVERLSDAVRNGHQVLAVSRTGPPRTFASAQQAFLDLAATVAPSNHPAPTTPTGGPA